MMRDGKRKRGLSVEVKVMVLLHTVDRTVCAAAFVCKDGRGQN